MGGTSSTQQSQSSTTQPWSAAQPTLNGILGQLNPLVQNSGLNSTEQGALNQLQTNAQAGNPYTSQISGTVSNLLNGGGATAQAPAINSAYQTYQQQTNPLASNTNYNPMNTPGFSDALNTMNSDITNQVNGQFAAAGRDSSGMNQQTLARGISQGDSQAIANQYNQNVQNQQGAAGSLYNAGNTTSGLLSGLNQTALGNQVQGITNSGDALSAQNYSPSMTLALQQQAQQIPAQNLGLLAQIGIPIAGLGSQSTGQSNGSSTMSGAQQFGQIAGGIGSLFGGTAAGGNAASNIFKLLSDRRAKEDITQVGTLFDGTPIYRYRYIGQPAFHIGLMAQDVEKYAPDAVGMIGPFKAVDYKLATDRAAGAA